MFVIGELKDQKMANFLLKTLEQKDIKAQIEYKNEGIILVLVEREDQAELARDLYLDIVGLPRVQKHQQVETVFSKTPMQPVTQVILGCSVLIYLSSWLFPEIWKFFVYKNLIISNAQNSENLLYEIKNGQVWRLFTPILLHFGILHMLFNGFCMKDFGNVLESYWGKGKYVFLICLFALGTNLSQLLINGPRFGGLSGILFAFFGYIWVLREMDKEFQIGKDLPKESIVGIFIWFILCLVGAIGNIANTAHGVGLIMGILIGVLDSYKIKEFKPKKFQKRILFLSTSLLILVVTLWVEYQNLKGEFYFKLPNI